LENKLVRYSERFNYSPINRKQTNEGRKYVTPDGRAVASVTTILDKTKPEEKKQALQEWRNRVGHKEAAAITSEAANRGTSMHSHLEHWLAHGIVENKSNLVHQQSSKMATAIIDNFLEPYLNEWWGSEVGLYYPELYAGTTDLVGVYKGVPSIIDFKQTNKPKRTEWIEDYFLQAAAYAAAHNTVHGTNIRQGVILMCSKDVQPQHWIVDLTQWEPKWFDRVHEYYLSGG
jgi:ATP-dependent exoDNAse (exonuclease V) beta subunit